MTSARSKAIEKEKFDRGLTHIVSQWKPTDMVPLDEALERCRAKAAAARTGGRTNTGCLYEALAEVYRLYLRIVAEGERATLNAWCVHHAINTAPKACPLRALVKLARLAVTKAGAVSDKKASKYAQTLRYAVIRKIGPDDLIAFISRIDGGLEARAGHFRTKFPTQRGRKEKAWKAPRIVFDEKARETFRNSDFIERGTTFLMAVRVEEDGRLTVLGCLPDGPQTKAERRRAGLPGSKAGANE